MFAFSWLYPACFRQRDTPVPAYGENNKHHRCNAKEKQQNQANPNRLQQQNHSPNVSSYHAYPLSLTFLVTFQPTCFFLRYIAATTFRWFFWRAQEHWFSLSSFQVLIRSLIFLFMLWVLRLFNLAFIQSFIHLFVQPFIYSFIPSVRPCIYRLTHPIIRALIFHVIDNMPCHWHLNIPLLSRQCAPQLLRLSP